MQGVASRSKSLAPLSRSQARSYWLDALASSVSAELYPGGSQFLRSGGLWV